jgi:hypothetical protein
LDDSSGRVDFEKDSLPPKAVTKPVVDFRQSMDVQEDFFLHLYRTQGGMWEQITLEQVPPSESNDLKNRDKAVQSIDLL